MNDDQTHDDLIRHLKGIREIVINKCHGGFGLSHEAELLYLKLAVIDYTTEDRLSRDETTRLGPQPMIDGVVWVSSDLKRDDPVLVSVVKRLGKKANGRYADLKIVKIPASVEWEIMDYDGQEWVAEQHRTWY
jgi:hypothetical protein